MSLYCSRCDTTLESSEIDQCVNCGQTRPIRGWPDDPWIDQEVAGGQFRVIRRLGAGGFGVVYEVETVVGGLRRALKVLKETWTENETFRHRFVHEAVVLERINHPNVARCYAAGTLDQSGEPYLLFELIEGVSLEELLQASALSPLRGVRLAKQIASGLVAAHGVKVLHRDLKPANVMVTGAGTADEKVKLLDFGIAKLLESEVTSVGELAGTPSYMAPEQLGREGGIGVRLDLWQLGATLHAMLTGKPPYRSPDGTWQGLISQYRPLDQPGPLPSETVPELASHPELDALVGKLLSTSPERRPASAAEVCSVLARVEQSLLPSPASMQPAMLDVLCTNPSRSSWAAIARFLDSQDSECLRMADEKLGHWPSELRRAPVAWWEVVRAGEAHPLWPLARTLDLSHRGLTDEDAAILAQTPAAAVLDRLSLAGNHIGPEGARALAGSPFLRGLTALDIRENRVGSDGLAALVSGAGLTSLTELHLGSNSVGVDGIRSLQKARLRLRYLDLSDNHLGPEAAELLAKAPLESLERLNFRDNLLGADGVALLAVSPRMAGLRQLNLAGNGIGPSGAASLALSGNCRQLRRLNLSSNHLGRQGLELLLLSAAFEALEELDLASNDVGPHGGMILASSSLARHLRTLDLSDNGLGDAGFAALLSSPQLMGLNSLRVAQNGISPSGVAMLDGAALQLQSIDLSANTVAREGSVGLQKAIGHLGLRHLKLNRTSVDGADLHSIVQGGCGALHTLEAGQLELDESSTAQLARAHNLVSLDCLALDQVWQDSRALAAMLNSPYLAGLRRLRINSNALGNQGMERLATVTSLPRLEELELRDNGVGPEGARVLAASPLASRLRKLDLSYNKLGDNGAEGLIRSGQWNRLEELRIRENDIGFGGAAGIAAASGAGLLQVLDLAGNPLISLPDLHAIDKDYVRLMESSFATISEQGHRFTERFYEKLFNRYPGVKPLFDGVSMRRQQEHLFSSLVMIIENLRRPEAVQAAVAAMGQRHLGYGVEPSHYYAVSSTLIETIREFLESDWTSRLEDAWTEGITAISRSMMDAHRLTRRDREKILMQT